MNAPLARLGESTAEAVERVLQTVCPGAARGGAVTVGHGVDQAAEEAVAALTFPAVAAEVCPVDIYAVEGGHTVLVEENLDECVLCGLCLDAAPDGAVRVLKLYDEGAALQRA